MVEDRKGTAEELSARFASIRELLREAVERSAEFLDATTALLAEMPGDVPGEDGGDEYDLVEKVRRLLVVMDAHHTDVAGQLASIKFTSLDDAVAHRVVQAKTANRLAHEEATHALAFLNALRTRSRRTT
ncbi:MAG: hypothetical protein Q7S96_05115 [bacterium]|nr:hypothetical protein [bacterium]